MSLCKGQEGRGNEGGGARPVPRADGWVQKTDEEEQEVLETFHSVPSRKVWANLTGTRISDGVSWSQGHPGWSI